MTRSIPVLLYGETPRTSPSFIARLLAAADVSIGDDLPDFELPRFPWIRRSPGDGRGRDTAA
ncbi:hypothetical protein C3941_19640 [Kaistia algarum]|nr:hypothetical protein C3941_19640 [Kaistia algarum]